MRDPLRRAVVGLTLALAVSAATPATSRADDDAPEHYDARVEGYQPNVELKSSSVGLNWLLVLVLGIACIGVMFKDPKRTHLD